jgi:5-methylcytosine-specific restriction endonuclease McrA
VEPLAPARYKVEFTADQEMRDMLDRLRALMRSYGADDDLAVVFKIAIREKLERLEAKRFAKTKKPRKRLDQTDTRARSRHIPAAVRRAVHQRDGGRCTFRDKRGRRCSKRHDLEFHHREPYGFGGDHSPENLTLMCKTHNALMAEQDYGKEVMWSHRRSTTPSAGRSGSASASTSASRSESQSQPPPGPVSRRRGHG